AGETLGQAERRHGGGDGAVRAVQSRLDAAAERGAVVERERWYRELAETPEHLVSGLADGQALLSPVHDLDGLEVGADGEHERLAGDAHSDDVFALDLVQRGAQRGQTARAERVRLGAVEAVVQSDEGEAA